MTLHRAARLYLSTDQQLKCMVNSGAFVKQQRFKLHLLNIIKRIKHHCQELEGDRERYSAVKLSHHA